MAQDQATGSDIEVGAADGDLRYWLAKEAVRQGEIRLTAQNTARTALEARATALTGWGAVGLLAAAGASFTANDDPAFVGATAASAVLFVQAALGIFAVRPRDWSLVGYEPGVVTAMAGQYATELEALEAIAGGLAEGVSVNNLRIRRTSRMLRWAGWLLITAPLVGAAAYRVRAAVTW